MHSRICHPVPALSQLESQIYVETLSVSLARRRRLLAVIGWLSATVWPLLSYMAYRTRPLETYTIIGLSAVSLLSVLYLILLHFDLEQHFYRRARQLVGVYMLATVLQTANVLFGSTEVLYLNGTPPLVIAGYQIIGLLAYVLLDRQDANLLTRIYGISLALLISGHALWRWDQFTSYYALALTFSAGVLLLAGTLVLIRMHLKLHLDALEQAQHRIASQQEQLDLAARDELTGALGEGQFRALLQQLMQSQDKFGVLAFKLIDEEALRQRLGEGAVDQLLREATELLAAWAEGSHRIGRGSSNTLYVCSPHIHQQAGLEQSAQFLLRQLDQLVDEHASNARFRVAGSIRAEHLDVSFLLEELSFRLFMAKLQPDRCCFSA